MSRLPPVRSRSRVFTFGLGISIAIAIGELASLGAASSEDPPRPASKQEDSRRKDRATNARRPYRVAAEHLLLRHSESFDARGTRLTKEQALRRASDLRDEIRRGRLTFERAVELHSQDPSAKKNGGYMGIFTRYELNSEFENVTDAIFGLEIGAISEPVHSPLGVHIFRRIPIREWAGRHILLQYRGRDRAPKQLERTRDEARAIARRVLAEARRPGAEFSALARRYSEAPDGATGGGLGIFGPGEILPSLERAIAALDVGALADEPVESPLGWHVVRRERIRRLHVAHVLVRFKGATESEGIERTREEARARAETVLELARAPEADFGAIAKRYSEDGFGLRGGDLGFFTPGQLLPAFEKAAFALKIGEISNVVETEHGFHVIRRLPSE